MLGTMIQKYDGNSKAVKHLKSIQKKKEKVCRAFTGVNFTAGGSASQRSESTNSVLKERGHLTKQQKKHNIFEVAVHINGKFEIYKASCVKEIIGLLKKKMKWSDWVDKTWKHEAL